MTSHKQHRQVASRLLAYAQLARVANLPTALADVAMGCLVVRPVATPWVALGALLGTSALLYTAGMVLNDVFDLQQDARERPQRPLPSGRIDPGWARWLGFNLLVLGVALGWIAGFVDLGGVARPWLAGTIATALAVCIVLYDVALKSTPLGPLLMGSCRALNVLLGMSVATMAVDGQWRMVGFASWQLAVAGGVGLFVAGLTIFARREAVDSHRGGLTAGLLVMALGVALLGAFPYFGDAAERLRFARVDIWPLLLVLLAFTVLRRALVAAMAPSPRRVQHTAKEALLSLIVFDAAVCLALCGPYYGLAVLALLLPALLLGRRIPMT